MQSSVKSFFGKEVSDIIVFMKGEEIGAHEHGSAFMHAFMKFGQL